MTFGRTGAFAEMGERPLIFLVAGEPSGDTLGAQLMAALKRRSDRPLTFVGVGGARMAHEGLHSLFPMDELSLMGAAEIVPHIPRLLRRIRETTSAICAARPDVVVTIDAPGFTFRVAKRVRRQDAGGLMKLVHYVAPQVWAWKRGRARDVAGYLDHLMALLPFEPPYFEVEGLACTFVGHPVVESGADAGDAAGFRRRHGLSEEAELVCVLPGSRRGEVRRLLPIFGATLGRLAQSRPNLRAVLPAVDACRSAIAVVAESWPVPTLVVSGRQERYDAFAAADAALAASGTVALELAMARTPMVIAYKLNPITAMLARRVIKTRYVNLVNLILEREVVPELLLGACRPDRLADAVGRLLDDPAARAAQRVGAEQAIRALHGEGLKPSERAADVVLSRIAGGPAYPVEETGA
jgi:lipid-A-disaccharide synthase